MNLDLLRILVLAVIYILWRKRKIFLNTNLLGNDRSHVYHYSFITLNIHENCIFRERNFEINQRHHPVKSVKKQGLQDLRLNIFNPAVRQSVASKVWFELIFCKQLSSFAPFKSSRHNCKFVFQIVSKMWIQ